VSRPAEITCPDCRTALTVVTSDDAVAHRCGRCRGVWLDPTTFQRLCEGEARTEGAPAALARSAPSSARGEERVRYRACPECGDVMSRVNFARVSGVVIDVCRPHGAWFDRGELGAIRAFLRRGGLGRYARRRRAEAEERREVGHAQPVPRESSVGDILDILDVLVATESGWIALLYAAWRGFREWLARRPG